MMTSKLGGAILTFAFLFGCGVPNGEYVLPDQVLDFHELYRDSCAGCHGANGQNGAARPLNDPTFLAIASKEKLIDTVSRGVPGTAMPAFARSAGGILADQQVAAIVDGMESQWAKPTSFAGVSLPAYSADPGDPGRGEAVYQTYCARCHKNSPKGSILDTSYLALVSPQGLRSSVLSYAGVSTHDWRSYTDHPMNPQEIADVVAFVWSHRAKGSQ